MSKQEFQPRIIGNPDLKTRGILKDAAETVLVLCNSLLDDMQILFADSEITFSDMEEFIKATDPVDHLNKLYVADKNISIPGIKTEKLIEQGLIDSPDKIYEVVLSSREITIEESSKLKIIGNPLTFMTQTEEGKVELTTTLEERIIELTQTCTESEIQNEILDQVESIQGAMNKLVEMGAISMSFGVANCLKTISKSFKHNRFNDIPTEIDPILFQKNVFLKGSRKYRTVL
ncbi:MAG: hypothetical protein N4A71_02415 [Carboxylicivirga sp.]|jgi:hypothetical protein|nr:hypothetical protein [Carboxylicivirga sp.]